jgi:hypothetical protein
MPASSATGFDLDRSKRKVQIIMYHDEIRRCEIQVLKDSTNHKPGLVHPCQRKNQQNRLAPNFTSTLKPVSLLGQSDTPTISRLRKNHPS